MSADPGADRPLAAVLAAHRERLLTLPGVVAVGEGQMAGRPCICVYHEAGSAISLPARLEGYPLVARTTGRLRAE